MDSKIPFDRSWSPPSNVMSLLMAIHETPGLTVGELKSKTSLGQTAFYTSLEYLEAMQEVSSCMVGRTKCIFPYSEEVASWGPQYVALQDQEVSKLYSLIRSLELTSTKEVYELARERFGWKEIDTRRYLNQLEKVWLIAPYYQSDSLCRVKYKALPVHQGVERNGPSLKPVGTGMEATP